VIETPVKSIPVKQKKNRFNWIKISLGREFGGYKAGKRKSSEARRCESLNERS